MVKKLTPPKTSKKKKLNHKQSSVERKQLQEKKSDNWKKRMKSTKVKKMSQGGQNMARSVKSRCYFDTKQLWGTKKKK